MTGAAHSLKVKYGVALDAGRLKRLVRRFELIVVLRKKRGRKNSPIIDAAYRDFRLGLSIAQIVEAHTSGYGAMNSSHKKAVRKRMQAALHRRKRKRLRELRELIAG